MATLLTIVIIAITIVAMIILVVGIVLINHFAECELNCDPVRNFARPEWMKRLTDKDIEKLKTDKVDATVRNYE